MQLTESKPMTPEQFCEYQAELVGPGYGAHIRLAELLRSSTISVKRYASGTRPIPDYIAQSLRAIALLNKKGLLKQLEKME